METHHTPMPKGIDAEMMQNCILILDAVEVTADDAATLTIFAKTEAAMAAVMEDPVGWIRRALRA